MSKKFLRQDIHKKKRLARVWRKPRGIDSKQRLQMQSRKIVKPGYRTAKKDRDRHKSGAELVYIRTLDEASKIKEGSIAIVDSKLGFRKKKAIYEKLLERKIKVMHTDLKKALESRIKVKKAKKEEEKPKEAPKKPAKKTTIEDTLTEEEKKKLEKKEIDKLLTKKV